MLYEKRRVPEERDDVEKEERKSEKEPGVPKPSTESCEGDDTVVISHYNLLIN